MSALGLTGTGRTELLELFRRSNVNVAELEARVEQLTRERNAYLANVTSTQGRCTELLLQLRASKVFQTLDAVHMPQLVAALLHLRAAVIRARTLHPKGCKYYALVEEVGEVARALRRETPERVAEECLDTAVVALRLFMGEWDRDEVDAERISDEDELP